MSDTIYRLKLHRPKKWHKERGFKTMDDICQKGIDAKAYPGCQLLVAKDGKDLDKSTHHFYETTEKVNYDLYDLPP